jgi:hypothetical protein
VDILTAHYATSTTTTTAARHGTRTKRPTDRTKQGKPGRRS